MDFGSTYMSIVEIWMCILKACDSIVNDLKIGLCAFHFFKIWMCILKVYDSIAGDLKMVVCVSFSLRSESVF